MKTINVKTCKKCAFCKYWYDPTNAYINPRNPRMNLWELDSNATCICIQKNIKLPASSVCSKYECKIVPETETSGLIMIIF